MRILTGIAFFLGLSVLATWSLLLIWGIDILPALDIRRVLLSGGLFILYAVILLVVGGFFFHTGAGKYDRRKGNVAHAKKDGKA